MKTKKCIYCGKEFKKRIDESVNSWKKHKYCSTDCFHETRKGCPAWNKGVPCREETKKKLSDGHKKTGHRPKKIFFAEGKDHPSWKGKFTGYHAKHIWITKVKGTPQKCEICGTDERRMYHWANIDHKYSRNPDDYIRLCVPCHKIYDL